MDLRVFVFGVFGDGVLRGSVPQVQSQTQVEQSQSRGSEKGGHRWLREIPVINHHSLIRGSCFRNGSYGVSPLRRIQVRRLRGAYAQLSKGTECVSQCEAQSLYRTQFLGQVTGLNSTAV